MKKLIILIFLIITGLSFTTTAQGEWYKMAPLSGSGYIFQVTSFNRTVYALNTNDAMAVTLDYGVSWISMMRPTNANSFFVNDSGVYYATLNNGVQKYYYSEKENFGLIGRNVKNVLVDSKGYIFAGVADSVKEGGGIYRTTDNGENWDYLIEGIESEHTNGLFIPYNITIIKDILYLMSANGFYYSVDDGQSWNMVISNKLDFKYNSPTKIIENEDGDIYLLTGDIFIKEKNDDFNNIQQVFVTNDSISFVDIAVFQDYIFTCTGSEGFGVFYSYDKGISFAEDKDGLNGSVICLGVSDRGHVYAATIENSFYRSTRYLSGVENFSKDAFKVYPNPFSETAAIKFNLETLEKINLTVYNTLGYKIAVLADEYLDSGNHEFVFDGTELPSGTYYYVLKAGSRTETGKLLLIK